MSRVLFVTAPERGHYHVLLGPAQHLLAAGHEVAFFAPRDLAVPLAAAGLGAVASFCAPPPSAPQAEQSGPTLAAELADPARHARWIRALLIDGVAAQLDHLQRVLDRFRPQVIVADPMVYAAPIAAARAGIPWIALSASLNPVLPDGLDSKLLATVRSLSGARAELFARFGLAPRFSGCDCLSSVATLVFASEALTGAPPPGVELVGPSRVPGRRGDESALVLPVGDAPVIYASLGSQNWHQPRWIARLIEAVRDRPVRLLIAAGGLAQATESVPANVRVVAYADQRAALAVARVFVTHGGANSVIEGLDAGVPLLVTPFVNDQPHNAWFVERAGVGRVRDPEHVTTAELAAELSALLGEGEERRAAARVRASFQQLDGARTAADRVQSACA